MLSGTSGDVSTWPYDVERADLRRLDERSKDSSGTREIVKRMQASAVRKGFEELGVLHYESRDASA